MREINPSLFSHISQTSVDSICQAFFGQIIGRIEPFFLHFSPQGLCNIQMRRIRRQKEQQQSSFLPIRDSFFYSLGFVYACIIQNHKGFLAYLKREFLQKFQYKFCVNVLLCNLPMTLTLPVYQSETVEFIGFFREKTNIFVRKLPSVRYIAFTASDLTCVSSP